MSVYAIIVAGGNSVRYGGDVPKQFHDICGRPMLTWTIEKFQMAESIDKIIIVVPNDYLVYVSEKVIDPYGFDKVTKIVAGGITRQESVYNGLKALPISTGFAAIHDGARPMIRTDDINRVVEVAKKEKGAILAVPVADTVKRVVDSFIITTVNREQLFCAQTPQVFQYDLIMEAHKEQSLKAGNYFTDDAQLIESRGFKVKIVVPSGLNLKITTPQDLKLAEALIEKGING
ncbi:MAG: 2-C-methyl-D-erythritol 4-phosphate cytidylyltransferase [bacterium]